MTYLGAELHRTIKIRQVTRKPHYCRKMTRSRKEAKWSKMAHFRTELQISNNIRKTNRIMATRVFLNGRNNFSMQKRLLKHQISVKCQDFKNGRKLSFFNFFEAVERLSSRKIVSARKRVPLTHHLHKKEKMSAVPLEEAPEGSTERCPPRSWPGDRFWSQGSD